MRHSKEKIQSFQQVAEPVIQWLNENTDPHTSILITVDRADLMSGEIGFPAKRYIKD